MPNINIDDAYILNETGAQVDKVTGLFTKDENTTSGEKAFAQLNIGTAGSNRNLLDNPWFTVNQRGQSSYTGRVYGVDRWIEYGSSNTVTVTSDGITLPVDTNSGFEQYFDDTFIQGKTVTISFMTADGTVTSKTVTWPTSGANMTAYTNGVAFFFGTVVGKKGLAILTNAEVTLRAVKLELGSVSTLANDAPPDYGAELAKCQRDLMVYKFPGSVGAIGFAYAHTTTNATAVITLPVPMRATPTISVVNSIALQQGTVRYNLTSPANIVLNGNVLTFSSPYTVVSGTAAAGTVGALLLRENAILTISAEP